MIQIVSKIILALKLMIQKDKQKSVYGKRFYRTLKNMILSGEGLRFTTHHN